MSSRNILSIKLLILLLAWMVTPMFDGILQAAYVLDILLLFILYTKEAMVYLEQDMKDEFGP